MGSIVSHIYDLIQEHGSWEKYQNSMKEVIHCQNSEVAKLALEKAKSLGSDWPAGYKVTEGIWNVYKADTCHNFESHIIRYSRLSHYVDMGYSVVSGEEFLNRKINI